MKRIFIAITFDPSFKDYLETVQSSLMKHAQKGKFHYKNNFHMTLAFIGTLPEEKIEPLWQSVLAGLEGRTTFSLVTSELSYFIKKNKKILWLGLEESQALMALQKEVFRRCSIVDHVSEPTYVPHITLGRQVVIERLPLLMEAYTFTVKEVALMESTSASGTLEYIPLRRYGLKEDKKNK